MYKRTTILKKKKRKGRRKKYRYCKEGKNSRLFFCIDNIFNAWDFVKKMSLV